MAEQPLIIPPDAFLIGKRGNSIRRPTGLPGISQDDNPLASVLNPSGFVRQGDIFIKDKPIGDLGVITDLASAPKDIIQPRPISTEEYFEFSKNTLTKVLAAHESKGTLLASGHDDQFVNYLETILIESGLKKPGKLIREMTLIIKSLSYQRDKELGEKSEESEKEATFWMGAMPFEHPQAKITKRDIKGAEVIKKDYQGEGTYDNLNILLLPEIWLSMDAHQQKLLLSGILFLFRYTKNIADINAPGLLIRLSQITRETPSRTIREMAYAIMTSLPFEQLPQTAKETTAEAITKNNEYGNELATALIFHDRTKIGDRLREQADRFEKEVLTELSVPVDNLAAYTRPQWNRLTRRCMQVNLLKFNHPDHVGIEIEIAPFDKNPQSGVADIDRLKKKIGADSPLSSCGVDQDCIEVRSGNNGFIPNLKNMEHLANHLKRILNTAPGVPSTLHIHVDSDTISGEHIEQTFSDTRTHTTQQTHEIRSLGIPLMQTGTVGQMCAVNVIQLQRILIFCAQLGKVTDENTAKLKKHLETTGYPDLEKIKKILTLTYLATADNPIQRLSAMTVFQRQKCFLSGATYLSILEEYGLSENIEAVLEYLPLMTMKEFVVDLTAKLGKEKLRKILLDNIDNPKLTDKIILLIINDIKNFENEKLIMEFYPRISNTAVRDEAIWLLTNSTVIDSINFAMSKYADLSNAEIRDKVITTIARHEYEQAYSFVRHKHSDVTGDSEQIKLIIIIGESNMPDKFEMLGEIYTETKKDHLRRFVIETITLNGKPRVAKILENIYFSKQLTIDQSLPIIYTIIKVAEPDKIDILLKIYARESQSMRAYIVSKLIDEITEKRKETGEKLLEIETDEDIKKRIEYMINSFLVRYS
ncbi:MAG: hypothetical protein A2538_02985 [Candidatus Magasanikbacteria bacterium RIFOXYD2_FULL_41_14]|uniref:Uncharacterized protein n=1 Tax=Candidatus Magasanikbacteria bacterium RIFOXYD2_FULL_41_14 TaxID=1798709 RepID=A0A1F6PCC2_9BACT|nr:MAG: hypothetical protein A2538_02985 [Candidatus Magasanikbacteria bacterium RIFOXYD2_FULL_41_14]